MTKRIYQVDFELFTLFINNQKLAFDDIPEGDFKKEITNLSCGCFVITTEVGHLTEALVLHRHFTHVNTMVSDLNLHKMKTCLNKHF